MSRTYVPAFPMFRYRQPLTEPQARVMIRTIQEEVARFYKVPRRLMQTKRRDGAKQRQVAMYLARRLTHQSLPEIGRRFGGRDHTTVIHAIKVVERRLIDDVGLAVDLEALRQRLAA